MGRRQRRPRLPHDAVPGARADRARLRRPRRALPARPRALLRDRLGSARARTLALARRMTMRLLTQLPTALALMCPINAAALPAAAQDTVRLLLDWFVNPAHAALVIAKQRGIFTKHGLDVELIAPADPNAPPKLVAAGQAEYAVSY